MKLAIIGFSGNVGRRIVEEALQRGHEVTGISRKAEDPSAEGLTVKVGDVDNVQQLSPLLAGHDAVISSVPFRSSDPVKLIEAVRQSGVKRYLVVGGAGSLETSPGHLLIDSPDLPEFVKPEAAAGKNFLDELRKLDDLEWTMLSPSALFTDGERTGHFRLGQDALLTSAEGKSWITYEDFAIALLDEAEDPQHIRERFTVGY